MKEAVSIEVDLFSGRPNPRIEILGADAKHLMQVLNDCQFTFRENGIDDHLGFRGFIVRSEFEGDVEYRVIGHTIERGRSICHDPDNKAQDFIISILPPPLRGLVEPFAINP